jgi:hypothetical protein
MHSFLYEMYILESRLEQTGREREREERERER